MGEGGGGKAYIMFSKLHSKFGLECFKLFLSRKSQEQIFTYELSEFSVIFSLFFSICWKYIYLDNNILDDSSEKIVHLISRHSIIYITLINMCAILTTLFPMKTRENWTLILVLIWCYLRLLWVQWIFQMKIVCKNIHYLVTFLWCIYAEIFG